MSLHEKIEPMVFRIEPVHKILYDHVLLKLSSDKVSESITFIEKVYKQFDPQSPFTYSFLDDQIDSFYRTEHRLVQMFNCFSFLAIFIACLGVYGMLSYSVEQRTREISIRKVLGANVSKIVRLVSREFLRCVVLANVVAWPVAYWAIHRWLRSFAYRANTGTTIFLLSAAITFVIYMMTVSHQSFRAAAANPVDSLRHE